MGTLPRCDVCQYHHVGQCRVRKYESCGRVSHSKETCWAGTGRGNGGQKGYGNGNGNNNRGGNGYGNRNQGGNGGNGNRGGFGNQAGSGNGGANNNQGGNGNGNGRGPGCFNCRDVGHFKRECPKINQAQGRNIPGLVASKLDIPYSIELANGKLVETNEVIRGCVIELREHEFTLDLLPIELGSFDVVGRSDGR
ncbi:heterogeneous nuclear ribonucleoprotein A1-like [Helianthus annuus]|uniref:heterogeneous nuclear ribonucleoprotein A1-like n=1 Tax=Helianthus annuus TaxID=4232 RepID=UPI000B8F9FE4|nr:heterogeneous nuclear ribonucleoprotein A1-like [Helianthus annuus]